MLQRLFSVFTDTQVQGPSFPILSLPELPFTAVLKCLSPKDRQALASTCRSRAAVVNAALQDTTLTVRSGTGWEGLRKVVASTPLTCKKLTLYGKDASKRPRTASSALDVLLRGSIAAPESFLRGTTEVCIDNFEAYYLPCLLPPNLARILPDMEHLQIYCHNSDQYADVQPLPYCSSLKALTYYAYTTSIQLPSWYHTPEDLRRQLPSISSLRLRAFVKSKADFTTSLNCSNTMLQAWGQQLTELKIWVMVCNRRDNSAESEWMPLQQCTQLQRLSWLVDSRKPPFAVLPSSLTELHLQYCVEEPDLETILHLPQLRVVRLKRFSNSLQHDWSLHPCTWQQLELQHCPFVNLSKLPLHSLKGEGCLSIKVLQLPDPRLPNSLPDVLLAAQHVSNAGVVVDMPRHDHFCQSDGWSSDLWKDSHADPQHDAALAEILRAASEVVKSPTAYQFQKHHLSHYPQTATALIRWLSSNLHEISFYERASLVQPWLWQAMQCCRNLSKILTVSYEPISVSDYIEHIKVVTMLAANYLVSVTQRPLCLQVVGLYRENKEVMQEIATQLATEMRKLLPASVMLKACVWEPSPKMIIALEPMNTSVGAGRT